MADSGDTANSGGSGDSGDSGPFPVEVVTLAADDARATLPALIGLLQDAVESGASIGFLPPLSAVEASAYWESVLTDVARGTRMLLVARDPASPGDVTGAVQLELATKPNARHRAEVQKLLVLRAHRRMGLGRRLMEAVERAGRDQGRTLLVLDTRQGDNAERLYRRLGWVEAGVIPAYARNREGALDATVIFYKSLASGASAGGQ